MAILNIKAITSRGPTTFSFRPEVITLGLRTTKHHFGAWFVIALTVMLLKGTLVPFMVAAPKVHV